MTMTKITGEEKQIIHDLLLLMLNSEAIRVEAEWTTPEEFRKLCVAASALCTLLNITDVVTEWKKKNTSRRFIY